MRGREQERKNFRFSVLFVEQAILTSCDTLYFIKHLKTILSISKFLLLLKKRSVKFHATPQFIEFVFYNSCPLFYCTTNAPSPCFYNMFYNLNLVDSSAFFHFT